MVQKRSTRRLEALQTGELLPLVVGLFVVLPNTFIVFKVAGELLDSSFWIGSGRRGLGGSGQA